MWRRSFIVTAIVFGALAGIVVGIQSPRVAHNLVAQLAVAARSNFGLRLEIKDLSLDLLPPAIHFGGVRVYRPDRSDPWIRVYSGEIRVRPWPSAAGAVVIDHLELDGFEIEHTLDPNGDLQGDFADTRLPVDIRELFVWNARVRVHSSDGEQGLACAGIDLTLLPHENGGRQITLDIPSATLTLAGREVGFEARSEAHLEGTLDRPRALSVERFRVFLSRIALQAAGRLALGGDESAAGGDSAKMQFTVEGGVALDQLHELIDGLPDVRGDAHLKAEIRSSAEIFSAPLVRLAGEIKNSRLAGQSLGDVGFNLLYEGSALNIEAFKVNQGHTSVTGSGNIDLDTKEVSVVARIHRASLPVVLAKAGLPDSWVRLIVNGDVQATGSLMPFRLDTAVDLDVEHFGALDRSYRDPDAIEVLGVDDVSVTGRARIGTRAVEVEGIRIERGSTALVADGLLNFNPDVGIDMRVSGEALDMADVGPIAGIDFGGTGTVFAAIEGPYKELTISGTPELTSFGAFGRVIGDTKATVIFEGLRLSVPRANFRRGRGTIKGAGWVDFDAEQPQMRADLGVSRVDLGGLLAAVGVESHRLRVAADVQGRVDLTGALMRPHGSVDLESDRVSLGGVPLGPMAFTVQFARRPDELAAITVEGEPAGGKLRATVGIRTPRGPTTSDINVLELNVDARDVPLATVRSLLGNVPVAGKVTVRATLGGPINGLTGELFGQVAALDAWGVHFGRTELRGDGRAGKVSITGTSLGGKAQLRGNLVIGRRLPYSVEAIIAGAAIHESVDLPRNVTLHTTGTVFSQGDLTRPASISADIQLSHVDLGIEDFAFALVRAARLTYGNGRLDIVDLGLTGAGLTANIGGRITAQQGLDIAVAAKGDLGVAVPLIPSLTQAHGPFDARLSIAGSVDAPAINGSAELHDVRVRPKFLRQDIEGMRARIEFTGRNVEIRDGSAETGGGTVTFGGGMLLPAAPGERTHLRLYSEFHGVTVRPVHSMVLTGSGRLNLAGPLGDLLLKGRVDVDELRYTKNLELTIDSLFPRRDAPLRAPNFAPGQTVAVDVHLEAPANVFLNAGAIDAEFRASLDFRGTTESLGLLGNLTPLTATARYRDLVFELVRGDIVFTEEFRVLAKYDIAAAAKGCGMDMTLNLVGDSRGKYTIEVTGEDENGPVHEQDPWSCISFGVRLSEYSGRTLYSDSIGAERTGIGETAGAVGDIIWGISGLDAKVRRLLPFVDEARISLGRSGRRGSRRLAPRLVVRKGIANKLQLKYDGSIDEADDQVLSLEYELSDAATLEGSWVSISDVPVGDFGLDLRLHWEFD